MSSINAELDQPTAKPKQADAQLEVASLNAMFESAEPIKVIEWAAAQFPGELMMTSSFGAESALLLHMANQVVPGIRIVMVDTGYLFPETWQHMELLRRRLNLNIWTYRTKNDPITWLHHNGEENPEWRKDVDACCAANKNEPMERAMKDLHPQGWLRGIRRSQSKSRENAQFVTWSDRYQCYAISPLLKWGSREIYQYMKKNDLPYHPLYEKGYPSIGCNPLSCTRPVQIGGDARSGRWAEADKLECGINLTNSLDSAGL
jgi:phosphoadenosine phosphosulfate reductase